ncbi:hypothetical protein [Plantactinospora sonchi]|uniref:Uncharacterized protein n=1 Tax=Plantactinospora sonchi TaxID=1544735 RepID=A0ABU7RL38_9ACTN
MGFSPTTMSEPEFREKLTKMGELTDGINNNSAKLFRNCHRAASILPPPLSNKINDALDRLGKLIEKFFEELAKIILNPGWPFGLMSAGDDWTEKIGGPASRDLVPKLNEDHAERRIDNKWSGPAAEAYAKMLPTQQKALETIKATTDALDSNLHKTAWGIFGLWAGVIVAVAMYVYELSGEAAGAATGFAAALAAAAAGMSTIKVTTLVTALSVALLAYMNNISDSMTTLKQTLAGLPEWPKSTTADFNDGKHTTKDPTDWRIRTND